MQDLSIEDILNSITMQNNTSVFTEVSKKVGWQKEPIVLPRKEFGMALLNAVQGGDINAFEAVLRYYRFGQCPQSASESEGLSIICQAFQAGKEIFEGVPA